MEGWIKLHRKLTNWEWYDNVNVRITFIHCLLVANYEEKQWQGKTIKRGQFVTSLAKLADAIGISVKQLRLVLKKLNKSGEISSKGANKFTTITVVNYDVWQGLDSEEGKQRANKGQTKGKQRATTKEVKNKRSKEGNSEPPTLSEINSVENPDTRMNKFLPFGLIDAKETLHNIYPTTEQKQTRIRELTGEDWTEQQAEDIFKSFYEIGITNYYNNLRNVDKLKAAFDNWITREAQFKKANKHEQQDETLEAHFKKYFSESKFSKLERNKGLQRMTIFYNENLFKFRNIAKSFENETITPQLIYELSHQALGRNLVGSSEDKKLKSFKKFLSTLTDYQRVKSDIREQLESFNKKTDRN